MSFEEELKQALRRREPSADFTARVLARCASEQTSAWANFWHRLRTLATWRFMAVAAGLVLTAGGTVYRQHEHMMRGEAAKRQLLLAVRIAGSKLQQAQQRVMEAEGSEAQQ